VGQISVDISYEGDGYVVLVSFITPANYDRENESSRNVGDLFFTNTCGRLDQCVQRSENLKFHKPGGLLLWAIILTSLLSLHWSIM
jgi:hypothetical protein